MLFCSLPPILKISDFLDFAEVGCSSNELVRDRLCPVVSRLTFDW